MRAALSILMPLVVLWGAGRLDLALYAGFGALASVYGRDARLPARLRMQAEAGLSLVLAVVVGVAVALSPDRSWLVIPVGAVAVTIVAYVTHRRRWQPPGVIFQVFALGACASVPATPGDLPVAAAVALGALVLGLLLTYSTSLLRHLWRTRFARRPAQVWAVASPAVRVGSEWPVGHYLVRFGLGAAIAGAAATVLDLGHPYWAMVTAVVPMAASTTSARLLRSGQRVIGTIGGVLLTAAILVFEPPALALIALIGLLQALAELYVARNYALALFFVTPLALCMIQLVHPVPIAELLVDRVIEIALGVAVAAAITLLTHERLQPGDPDA